MRHLIIILTALIHSCGTEISEKEIETKAIKITQLLDSSSVTTFYDWNFFLRGADNWVKMSGDSDIYSCGYDTISDTTILTIYQPDRFVIDFPCSFSFDTSKYWRFQLKMYGDNTINIIGASNNNGRDITLTTGQELNILFPNANPFDKFSTLTKLKDSLKVIAIHSFKNDIGYYIQFYLSRQHILTYLPDSIDLNRNDIWKQEFAKGKTIKKNWNLRKLDGQLDNG